MERIEDSCKMKVDIVDGVEDEIGLIDISSEDDFLIAPSFRGNFDGLRLSVAFDGVNVCDGVPQSEKGLDHVEHAVNGFNEGKNEYNCRNSLAWDTAFFTSAGVLDPEELSLVNRGYRRSNCSQLPGIGENIQGFAESNSTVDSNASSLQRLESVLFEDVRTVQKSRRKLANEAASKSMDVPSRKMLKSVPVTGGQTMNAKGLQHAARSRALSLSARKPPKSSSHPAVLVTPAKRSSPGANGRMESKTSKSGLSQMAAKKPCLGVSFSLPSCSTSCVTISSPSRTASSETVTSSSYGISGKSPLSTVRRKIDSRKDGLSSTVSSLRTPLRSSALGSRSKSQISANTTGISTPKVPSNESPSSPMNLWSSVSSTASSTTNQGSIVLEANHDPTPNRGALFFSPATEISFGTDKTPNHRAAVCASHRIRASGHGARSSSKSSSTFSRSVSNTYKPSGLRLPTSKYGLFDEEKPCLPDEVLHFDSGSSDIPATCKSNASNYSVAEYRKHCKLPSARSSTGTKANHLGAAKTGNPCSASSTNPIYSTRFPGSKSCPPRVPSKPRAKKRENIPVALNKENSLGVQHQVDDLGRNLELISLHGDVVIELEGRKGAPKTQLGEKHSASFGQKEELLSRTMSKNGWFSLPSSVEIIPSPRNPLAVKDSLYNRSGFFEVTLDSGTSER